MFNLLQPYWDQQTCQLPYLTHAMQEVDKWTKLVSILFKIYNRNKAVAVAVAVVVAIAIATLNLKLCRKSCFKLIYLT